MRTGKSRNAGTQLAANIRALENSKQQSRQVSHGDLGRRNGTAWGTNISRVQRGIDGRGTPYIKIEFGHQGENYQFIDATFLLNLPNLLEPFLYALSRYLESVSSRSRYQRTSRFKRGLCTFLATHRNEVHLTGLTGDLTAAYVAWQKTRHASLDGKRILNSSRSQILVARRVLEHLRKHPKWGRAASKVLDEYPRNTHPGPREPLKPRELLARELLNEIRTCCFADINSIRHRLSEGERLLAEGNDQLGRNNGDYRSPAAMFAAMVLRYPRVFAHHSTMRKEAPELAKKFYVKRDRPELTKMAAYRYASARDLVPFVLLLAIEGAYNPETILNLTYSGIKLKTVLGVSVVSITGTKERGYSRSYGKDLDPVIVWPLLDLLQKLTERLRDELLPTESDKVFVFAPMQSTQVRAKSFRYANEMNGSSSDVCWKSALRRFRLEYELPPFTLGQIRPSLLDLVGQKHGSIAAQRAAQHRSFQTTDGHYLGPGTKNRDRERMAETVQYMHRWIVSGGKVDVRRCMRKPSADKGAATPGFACADPYDSPIPGQTKHRLCRAYGMCVTCPLAFAEQDDYQSVAHWLALEQAIYRAREQLDPQCWLEKWAPIATALARLIQTTPAPTLIKAKELRIYAPTVG